MTNLIDVQLWQLTCPNCKAEAKSFYSGCKQCGRNLHDLKRCMECENFLDPTWNQCDRCGLYIYSETSPYATDSIQSSSHVSAGVGQNYDLKLSALVAQVKQLRESKSLLERDLRSLVEELNKNLDSLGINQWADEEFSVQRILVERVSAKRLENEMLKIGVPAEVLSDCVRNSKSSSSRINIDNVHQ